jgi:hypothetical protein
MLEEAINFSIYNILQTICIEDNNGKIKYD